MDWAAVRDRYLAVSDKTGTNIAWHLAIGYYVADRWIAEGVVLQGQAYDHTLTDPVWDRQLTLAALEKLEKDATTDLEAYVQAAHDGLTVATVQQALQGYGALKPGDLGAELASYGAAKPSDLTAALTGSDKLSWPWFGKTMLEGPISALGIVVFGFVLTCLAAVFSPIARDALVDLGGKLVEVTLGKEDPGDPALTDNAD